MLPKLSIVFSSSTIFSLPNGGDRSPDAAWIEQDRWNTLTDQQKKGFPPICPDFVIELRSQSDALKPLQSKMSEYLYSGLKLGWLIDPQNNQVEIYRGDRNLEIVQLPTQLLGDNILPEFILNITLFCQFRQKRDKYLCKINYIVIAKRLARGAMVIFHGNQQYDAYDLVAKMFPAGRWGTSDDAAKLVHFLHSDYARWITGQTIASEGGFRR